MATARISSTNAFPSSPLAAGAISVVAAASLLDVTTDAPVTGRAAATGTDTLFHLPEAVLGGAWRARARAEESDAGGMAWWRIGLPYSALVRLEFRAREGKPPMKNDSDRDRAARWSAVLVQQSRGGRRCAWSVSATRRKGE
jgi:hypothetical protein